MQPTVTPPATVTPSSTFVVRVCGLPVSQLRALHLVETRRLVTHLNALDERLERTAERLCASLEEAIGALPEGAQRFTMIQLRRALHNRRVPKRLDLSLLPDDFAEVHTWLHDHAQREALLAAGEQTLAAETHARRAVLKDLAARPAFLRGLLTSNPSFHSAVDALLKGRALDAKAERKLSLYLSRAAANTSPLSTFTSQNVGRWTAQGESHHLADRFRSTAEISRSILGEVVAVATSWPEVRDALPVKLNSSAAEHPGRFDYVAWRRGEVLVSVSRGPALDGVVRRLPAPTYGQLVRSLTQAHPHLSAKEWRAYLDKLLRSGLLELALPVAEQALDPVRAWLRWLDAVPGERARFLRAQLYRLAEHLDVYVRSPDEQPDPSRREAILAPLDALYDWPELKRHGVRQPRRNHFFEDTRRDDLSVSWADARWADIRRDADLLRGLVGLFDPRPPAQARLARAFREQPESSLSLLDFYKRVHAAHAPGDELRRFGLVSLRGDLPAELAATTRTQQAVLDSLPRHLACAALEPTALERLLAATRRPHSLALYAQMVTGGTPQLVVNRVQAGYGRTQARLARLLDAQGEHAPHSPHLVASDADDFVYAELAGVFRSTINLRRSRARYEVIYPGYISQRSAAEQLPLSDLFVTCEPGSAKLVLRSRRLGKAVRPFHGGMMGEAWLPPLYRFLLLAFGDGPVDPTRFSLQQLAGWWRAPEQTTELPRVTLGQLVIDRARWLVPEAEVPRRAKGQGAFRYHVALDRWRTQLGVPEACFVTFGGKFKPTYIDFRDPFSVDLFDHRVRRQRAPLILEEMLPEPGGAHLSDGPDHFVSEYVLEINRGERHALA